MELDITELRDRWVKSWEAWQYEIDKFILIDRWYTAYEKHLRTGETWDESYRFPELFGAVQRKYDNLVEFWPEMRPKGKDTTSFQAAYTHVARIANLQRTKNRVGFDAIKFGVGCLYCAPVRYEREIKGKGRVLSYDGLGAERVDPRDIIPAYSALVMHDHTGRDYCPFVFRRRVYYYNTFMNKFGDDPKFKNIDKVRPTTYTGGFTGDRTPTQREGIEKETGEYVTVLEYWDQENDIMKMFANSFENEIYNSPDGIPYSHKQLPFHLYYDYRRWDSIAGIGEIELNMPYNLFREQVHNLMIDNAKLELQPAYIIDGNIDFNSEEQELEPGAIFTVRGVSGGRLEDHIMPFRPGGIAADIPAVMNAIEDSRIVVTGDDTRSLYANPTQLATQTLAKREALQKRIRGNIIRNTAETEFYLANQIMSYLKNELAKPYQGEYGVTHRKISIEGFEAVQDKKESPVKFEKTNGAVSDFYLNPAVAEDFKEIEIEVIPIKLDEEIKRDQTEKMILFMQTVMQTAQLPDGQKLLAGMDVGEFLKQIADNMNLDTGKIWTGIDKTKDQIDVIDAEHQQISMGVVPEIKPNEDSMEHYMAHTEFEKSAVFKKLGEKAKKALEKHKILTLQNVQTQVTNLGKPKQEGVGVPSPAGQSGAVPSFSLPVEKPAGQTEGRITPSSFRQRVREGQDVRAG